MKPEVQSLWIGNRLSRMEHYSIKSFLRLGYKFFMISNIYTFSSKYHFGNFFKSVHSIIGPFKPT